MAAAATVATFPGCLRDRPSLSALTDWSPEELVRFRAASGGLSIRPVRPSGGVDPTRAVGLGAVADLVIGGPIASFVRLSSEGRLRLLDREAGRSWVVARRSAIGLVISERALEAGPSEASSSIPRTWAALGSSPWTGRVALGDPRVDPVMLAACESHLETGPWPEAYAELVRAASQAAPIGRGVDAVSAQLRRGRADVGLLAVGRSDWPSGLTLIEGSGLGELVEGAAVLRGAARAVEARRVVEAAAIEDAGRIRSGGGLLADLLGATLVDAQPELVSAAAVIARSDRPEARRAAGWMVQAPPWPPASVSILKERPGGAALVRSLADQLVAAPTERDRLLASWERPPAPLDGETLDLIAAGADGRFAGSPRLMTWLRGEWTAWARQRYRRAERLAAGKVGLA